MNRIGGVCKGRFIMLNSSGNRNKGGDVFREWLSDRLRYFILLAALIVAIAAISMFSRLLDSNMNRNNRNMNQSGSASAVKTEKETEEAIVILSEGGETSQPVQQEQSKDAADESAGEVTQESTPETVAEETKAVDAAEETVEETVTETQTQQAVEETTEEQTEEVTEEVTEEAADKVTEKQTEEVTEKVTEKAEEEVTEKVTEKAEEEVTEKVTEKAEEEVTEKVTEKAEEEVTEKVTEKAEEEVTEKITEKAEEEVTEKTSERHSGLMTTSSTERTVHTSSDSKKPVTAATLAGVGAEEETETESRVTTGNIIVTNTGSSARVTVLVTGGSSTSGNRASVTNIDTGNTIGTYRRVANTGSVFPTINTGSTANTGTTNTGTMNTGVTDNSNGLIQPADGSVTDSSSAVDVVAQQEVVPVAPPAPEPEYRTVVSACNIRSYPDYGDNVIGGLYGGETVLFYGLEAGWDKIEYNGIVGYIGPKFLR